MYFLSQARLQRGNVLPLLLMLLALALVLLMDLVRPPEHQTTRDISSRGGDRPLRKPMSAGHLYSYLAK